MSPGRHSGGIGTGYILPRRYADRGNEGPVLFVHAPTLFAQPATTHPNVCACVDRVLSTADGFDSASSVSDMYSSVQKEMAML